MSQPSIALIFNPAARGEKARSFRESLGQMQAECTLLETTAPGSATDLAAQAVRDGYKTIVATGGDGKEGENPQQAKAPAPVAGRPVKG